MFNLAFACARFFSAKSAGECRRCRRIRCTGPCSGSAAHREQITRCSRYRAHTFRHFVNKPSDFVNTPSDVRYGTFVASLLAREGKCYKASRIIPAMQDMLFSFDKRHPRSNISYLASRGVSMEPQQQSSSPRLVSHTAQTSEDVRNLEVSKAAVVNQQFSWHGLHGCQAVIS